MSTLYLMRHGQTLFNLKRRKQGWCDSPLTELGIAQAKKAQKYFEGEGLVFDHAYSSTSERACDTLEIVTDGKMPYVRQKNLKEWNFGMFEGESEDLNPQLPYGDFYVYAGGEEEMEFRARAVTALTEIMNRPDHEQVLVVGHGAFCAQFARNFEKNSEIGIVKGFGNCNIMKFRFEDDKFTLVDWIKTDTLL